MAALNFASAPTAINRPLPASAHNYNYQTQQPTPLSSATATPTTPSPTSPRTSTSPPLYPSFSRQLHPPKVPLYTPAVLRPTERPSRHAHTKSASSNTVARVVANATATGPLTPPSSADNSYKSRDGEALAEESLQRKLLLNDGIARVVTDEWNDDSLEDVTGIPTRDHWKPDSSSPTCDFPPCPYPFTMLRRRHHCRRCGNIFCATHSHYEVPLDQHARFHPQGIMARACDSCFSDFITWQKRRSERNSNASSESGLNTPVGSQTTGNAKAIDKAKAKDPQALVGSVPRDWNWSTF